MDTVTCEACTGVVPRDAIHSCPMGATGWRRQQRATTLENHRPRLIDYLRLKFEAEDWHGVQDAASDLRDLDNELDGLRY